MFEPRSCMKGQEHARSLLVGLESGSKSCKPMSSSTSSCSSCSTCRSPAPERGQCPGSSKCLGAVSCAQWRSKVIWEWVPELHQEKVVSGSREQLPAEQSGRFAAYSLSDIREGSPRLNIQSPSLKILITQLDTVLDNVLSVCPENIRLR